MEFKEKYILGEGRPFVIKEVCQLFKIEKGKTILIGLKVPDLMGWSGPVPNYRLILERIDNVNRKE